MNASRQYTITRKCHNGISDGKLQHKHGQIFTSQCTMFQTKQQQLLPNKFMGIWPHPLNT